MAPLLNMTERQNILSTVCAAACLLAAGCASNVQFVRFPDQTKPIQDPAKARIYVVRPTSYGGVASMEIWDAGRHVANTGPESYVCWERDPGRTEVTGREENASTVNLDLAPAQIVYIWQHVSIGWAQARNRLEIVSDEKGRQLVSKCKPPKPGHCSDHPECRSAPPNPDLDQPAP